MWATMTNSALLLSSGFLLLLAACPSLGPTPTVGDAGPHTDASTRPVDAASSDDGTDRRPDAAPDSCGAGHLDCNGEPDDGCEVDGRDRANCGRCGVVCGSEEFCSVVGCVTIAARPIVQLGHPVHAAAFADDGSLVVAAVADTELSLGGETIPAGALFVDARDSVGERLWLSVHPSDSSAPADAREGVWAMTADARGTCATGTLARSVAMQAGTVGQQNGGAFIACWNGEGENTQSWEVDSSDTWVHPRAMRATDGGLEVVGRAHDNESSQGWFATECGGDACEPVRNHLSDSMALVAPMSIAGKRTVWMAGLWRGTLDYGRGTLRSAESEATEGFLIRRRGEEEAELVDHGGTSLRALAVGELDDAYAAFVMNEESRLVSIRAFDPSGRRWASDLHVAEGGTCVLRAAAIHGDVVYFLGLLRGHLTADAFTVDVDESTSSVVLLGLDRGDGRALVARTWTAPGGVRLNELPNRITQSVLHTGEDGVRFLARFEGQADVDGHMIGAEGRATWAAIHVQTPE